jgi:hypothetical protein
MLGGAGSAGEKRYNHWGKKNRSNAGAEVPAIAAKKHVVVKEGRAVALEGPRARKPLSWHLPHDVSIKCVISQAGCHAQAAIPCGRLTCVTRNYLDP